MKIKTMDDSGFFPAGHINKIEVYVCGTPLKIIPSEVCIDAKIVNSKGWPSYLLDWKNLSKINNYQIDCSIDRTKYKALKELLKSKFLGKKPKYPRKMKKKIFGTKKAKNKLMKKRKQDVFVSFCDLQSALVCAPPF